MIIWKITDRSPDFEPTYVFLKFDLEKGTVLRHGIVPMSAAVYEWTMGFANWAVKRMEDMAAKAEKQRGGERPQMAAASAGAA